MMNMKKGVILAATLAALIATGSVVAATAQPLSWISLSSNISSGVNMNCKGNTGGTGSPMLITSAPQVSWWGGISGHFQGTNLKCTFSLPNTKTVVGSMHVIVFNNGQSTPLSATIYHVKNMSGYTLTAAGSEIAPRLQPNFFDYTVTMNTTG